MKARHQGKVGRCAGFGILAVPSAALALFLLGGCSTSIRTALPDVGPSVSTTLSQEERKKAVEELNKARATHEQDAEQQIEQSR
jgi:hypothetical protein